MSRLWSFSSFLLWSVLGCAACLPARAETFPSRPIRLIVPYSPGGIVDFTGRELAQQLTAVLGQPVVVENRPGAGGMVGVGEVAHGTSDGYTVVLIDPSVVINPTLQKSMPYDIFKDLVTISIVCSSPHVLVVSPQLPVKTFAELVAYGEANPGALNYASAGVGTTPHLAGELFLQRTGIKATHVPYKGVGPSFVDLMSGKVQMEFASIAGALPFTSKGSIVPLATTGLTRSPVYPDLPTVSETIPDFTASGWSILVAPHGTPEPIVGKINADLRSALTHPDLLKKFEELGNYMRAMTPQELAAFVRSERQAWGPIVKQVGAAQ